MLFIISHFHHDSQIFLFEMRKRQFKMMFVRKLRSRSGVSVHLANLSNHRFGKKMLESCTTITCDKIA